MKSFLLCGVICVPVYIIARAYSDTFVCGGFAAILCNFIIHSIEERRA